MCVTWTVSIKTKQTILLVMMNLTIKIIMLTIVDIHQKICNLYVDIMKQLWNDIVNVIFKYDTFSWIYHLHEIYIFWFKKYIYLEKCLSLLWHILTSKPENHDQTYKHNWYSWM